MIFTLTQVNFLFLNRYPFIFTSAENPFVAGERRPNSEKNTNLNDEPKLCLRREQALSPRELDAEGEHRDP